jgi:hypothetical protein
MDYSSSIAESRATRARMARADNRGAMGFNRLRESPRGQRGKSVVAQRHRPALVPQLLEDARDGMSSEPDWTVYVSRDSATQYRHAPREPSQPCM